METKATKMWPNQSEYCILDENCWIRSRYSVSLHHLKYDGKVTIFNVALYNNEIFETMINEICWVQNGLLIELKEELTIYLQWVRPSLTSLINEEVSSKHVVIDISSYSHVLEIYCWKEYVTSTSSYQYYLFMTCSNTESRLRSGLTFFAKSSENSSFQTSDYSVFSPATIYIRNTTKLKKKTF